MSLCHRLSNSAATNSRLLTFLLGGLHAEALEGHLATLLHLMVVMVVTVVVVVVVVVAVVVYPGS